MSYLERVRYSNIAESYRKTRNAMLVGGVACLALLTEVPSENILKASGIAFLFGGVSEIERRDYVRLARRSEPAPPTAG